ncbi:MAG: hypothetical protein WC464_03120 [Bdellovibrionales bacterium]
MEGDLHTQEKARREALKTAGENVAPDIIPRTSFLPGDNMTNAHTTGTARTAVLTPEADAVIEVALTEKKERDMALASIAQALHVNVDSAELVALTRDRSTKDLKDIAAGFNSPHYQDKKRALEALGTNDPEYEKRIKEDAEKDKAYLSTLAAVGIVAVAASAGKTPASAATVGTAVPVSTTASGDTTSVLPGVSDEIIAAAPTAGDLGVTLFGRSGGLNRLTVENSVATPAPSATSKKSVAEQVLSSSPFSAMKAAAPSSAPD